MALSPDDPQLAQARRRSEVSTLFIGFLIGIAISEAISPAWKALNSSGFTVSSVALFAIFLMTVIRFFIGYQLHLMDEKLLSMKGSVWFFDFTFIVFETIILIFMAEVCTIEAGNLARYKFVEMLIWLLAADVLWALLQQGASWFLSEWKRRVLWGWGISGFLMIGAIGGIRCLTHDLYSRSALILLIILNAIAFIVDLRLIDHYGLFRRNPA